jgi:hypothetical protein
VLDRPAPQELGDLLRDLNDLLAAGGLGEVELDPPFVGQGEDEPETEGVLSIVAGGLSVPLQVTQVFVEQDIRQQRVGVLHERAVHLDNPSVDVGIDPNEVDVRPFRFQEDVAASGLDRGSHCSGRDPDLLGASPTIPDAATALLREWRSSEVLERLKEWARYGSGALP